MLFDDVKMSILFLTSVAGMAIRGDAGKNDIEPRSLLSVLPEPPEGKIDFPPACCSLDFKTCATWCEEGEDACKTCGGSTAMFWMEHGSLNEDDTCLARWDTCSNTTNTCCPGLVCHERDPHDSQCLHPDDALTEQPLEIAEATEGCCSLDFKTCADWCTESQDVCESCDGTPMFWLEDGALDEDDECLVRWDTCSNTTNTCCDGLVCYEQNPDFSQCLHPDQVPQETQAEPCLPIEVCPCNDQLMCDYNPIDILFNEFETIHLCFDVVPDCVLRDGPTPTPVIELKNLFIQDDLDINDPNHVWIETIENNVPLNSGTSPFLCIIEDSGDVMCSVKMDIVGVELLGNDKTSLSNGSSANFSARGTMTLDEKEFEFAVDLDITVRGTA